jgi:hypothetical protein
MLQELAASMFRAQEFPLLDVLYYEMDAASSSYVSVTTCAAGWYHVMTLITWTFISTAVKTWNLAQEVTTL